MSLGIPFFNTGHLLGRPVQLLTNTNHLIYHMMGAECISICRHGQDDMPKFKLSISRVKKEDFSDLNVAWLLVADGLI